MGRPATRKNVADLVAFLAWFTASAREDKAQDDCLDLTISCEAQTILSSCTSPGARPTTFDKLGPDLIAEVFTIPVVLTPRATTVQLEGSHSAGCSQGLGTSPKRVTGQQKSDPTWSPSAAAASFELSIKHQGDDQNTARAGRTISVPQAYSDRCATVYFCSGKQAARC